MKEICIGQFRMARYDELLQMAEALWRKERSQKVPVEGCQ